MHIKVGSIAGSDGGEPTLRFNNLPFSNVPPVTTPPWQRSIPPIYYAVAPPLAGGLWGGSQKVPKDIIIYLDKITVTATLQATVLSRTKTNPTFTAGLPVHMTNEVPGYIAANRPNGLAYRYFGILGNPAIGQAGSWSIQIVPYVLFASPPGPTGPAIYPFSLAAYFSLFPYGGVSPRYWANSNSFFYDVAVVYYPTAGVDWHFDAFMTRDDGGGPDLNAAALSPWLPGFFPRTMFSIAPIIGGTFETVSPGAQT